MDIGGDATYRSGVLRLGNNLFFSARVINATMDGQHYLLHIFIMLRSFDGITASNHQDSLNLLFLEKGTFG